MTELKILGVGHGGTLELFNTCFVIKNEAGDFLIDTGGSIEIINRLNKVNIDYRSLRHIFISHAHTDHILGLIWMLKKMYGVIRHGKINENINIYCNDEVYTAIEQLLYYTLPSNFVEAIHSVTEFKVLKDGDRHKINGIDYEFFDIIARGAKQYGFECKLKNKKFVFLGDETINPQIYSRVQGADFVTHEAFCLESEEKVFRAYEKHHSTVKSVCETMNSLNVKNLMLYHTEESHGTKRKELYLSEGKEYFNGNLMVPDELETIVIE